MTVYQTCSVQGQKQFEVRWHPFQLNPQADPKKGVNKMEMYKEKFGEERVKQMVPVMTVGHFMLFDMNEDFVSQILNSTLTTKTDTRAASACASPIFKSFCTTCCFAYTRVACLVVHAMGDCDAKQAQLVYG